MARTVERSGQERRSVPRYPTRHRVEGVAVDPQIGFRGILCDLSAGGCNLHLDTRMPPGTVIEARCDISGIGLRIRGKVVWAEAAIGGVLHGVLLTGPTSEGDALFHRLYVSRLARQTLAAPEKRGH